MDNIKEVLELIQKACLINPNCDSCLYLDPIYDRCLFCDLPDQWKLEDLVKLTEEMQNVDDYTRL